MGWQSAAVMQTSKISISPQIGREAIPRPQPRKQWRAHSAFFPHISSFLTAARKQTLNKTQNPTSRHFITYLLRKAAAASATIFLNFRLDRGTFGYVTDLSALMILSPRAGFGEFAWQVPVA